MVYKTLPMQRIGKKMIHMMLQFFALVLGIFGIYVAFKYHRMSQTQNMTTLHSWLGICTICLFGLQVPVLPLCFFFFFYSWQLKILNHPLNLALGLYIRPSPITVVKPKCKTGRINAHTDFFFFSISCHFIAQWKETLNQNFSELEHITYSQLPWSFWDLKMV